MPLKWVQDANFGRTVQENAKILDDTSLFRLTEMAEALSEGALMPAARRAKNYVDSSQVVKQFQPGHELWNAIDRDTPASQALFAKLQAEGPILSNSGKLERNDVLRALGYDTIRHAGGMGGPITHDVAIALRPENVFAPWDVPYKKPIPPLISKKQAAGYGAAKASSLYGGQMAQATAYP
jgi:hypothetical protein